MSPEDVCSEQGCTGPIRQRSLCNRHYIRARRSGALDTSRKPEAERFWSHTRRVAECLEWTGPTDLHGYGRFYSDGGKRVRRSEEHTSELQSRENLVCRLLLEKKKKT